MNKIYHYINEILNNYLNEGIDPKDLMSYLNTDEENFDLIYNKLYKKLTLDDVSFESNQLKEALIDSIQDKINFIQDISK